jgi:ComF family protein
VQRLRAAPCRVARPLRRLRAAAAGRRRALRQLPRRAPAVRAGRCRGRLRLSWSGLVTAFKFHAAIDLAEALSQRLAEAVRGSVAVLPQAVLPVPLGRERLAERGMNQAWELARRVAARLQLPAQPRWLERRVETPHLADLPRDERARAIRGAFGLAPGAATALRGQTLALVDDVMTTGATAAEAARTLLAGGAASVQLWVFARTP